MEFVVVESPIKLPVVVPIFTFPAVTSIGENTSGFDDEGVPHEILRTVFPCILLALLAPTLSRIPQKSPPFVTVKVPPPQEAEVPPMKLLFT